LFDKDTPRHERTCKKNIDEEWDEIK